MNLEELKQKWRDKRKNIINPDGMDSWDDLGFDEPPEGYDSIDDFLEHDPDGEELDEGQQTELRVIDEILDDLEGLKV